MTLVPPIRWLVTDIALKAGSPIMATDFFQLPEAAGANGLVEHPRDWFSSWAFVSYCNK